MIIRIADMEKDALAIMEGAKDFISRMDYTECLPKTDKKLCEAISRIITMEQVEVIVAEYENNIVGAIGMLYSPMMWNPEITGGEEIFWWTAKDAPITTALRLLKFVQNKAKKTGLKFLTFKKLTSSPENVKKVYARMGLTEIETSFMGAV